VKRRFSVLFLFALLVIALLTPADSLSSQTRRAERESHPRIANAIHALQAARDELQAAPHDFGGHKAAAIEACDNALKELKQALDYRAAEDHHHR
jgi:hypothetical protein